MVMVDSSVWIDTIRGRETRETLALDSTPPNEGVAIADLCLFEALRGVQPEKFEAVYTQLRRLSVIPVGGEQIAVQAARNARLLRARGIQPTAVDCLLATYCIVNGVRLLSSDSDFEPFAAHLGLSLVR